MLQYKRSGDYREDDVERTLYSTMEKAIEAFPAFMDAHNEYGDDWRNGLEGLGKGDEDNYLGFDCYVDQVENSGNGGVLITNEHADGRSKVVVCVKSMLLDPPFPSPREKVEDDIEGDLEGDLGGYSYGCSF